MPDQGESNQMPDAHFVPGKLGGLVCEHCRRAPSSHNQVQGTGKFKGWTRYICRPVVKGRRYRRSDCPVCSREVPVRSDGRFFMHGGTPPCRATHRKVMDPL